MRRPLTPGTLAIATSNSTNRKLGDAATTYAAQTSCPTDCVFFDGGGCYAESGSLGKFVTAPLNAAARSIEHTDLDVALARRSTGSSRCATVRFACTPWETAGRTLPPGSWPVRLTATACAEEGLCGRTRTPGGW